MALLACLALGGGALGTSAIAQQAGDEAQVKAAFVYNFMKFVEWPVDATQRSGDSLVVAVIGDGDVADAAARFLAGKQVGDRRVVVHRTKWDQPLAGAQVAFVTESDGKRLRHIVDATSSHPVLSIGDAASFATIGGIIGLVVEDRRVRFDIDTDAADAAGLKVSSKLLALSRTVRSSKNKSGDRP
jgi:hypothetical protein